MTKTTKASKPAANQQPAVPGTSKLDQLTALLSRQEGATLADLMAATAWQAHSVRGAIAGALRKKRGLTIVSQKIDGVRVYSLAMPDQ
ncbi:DUF3489 domain-containing protein [Phenylobacterium sp.]|uniref:DUF3489 domain-containing protein n=1 Tax=Phenylobacterium sp. TaxID=1871053 RepID=UPI003569ED09